MQGFGVPIEDATIKNTDFRRVLYTAPHSQLVLMSLAPSEEIGEEVHKVDQFIRVETGSGKSILNGEERALPHDSAIVIPAGTKHNIINTGAEPIKLYTIYSPPQHPDGTVHKTKAEADAAEKDE